MNLWVKYKGQLATLAVALIFFACVDESSILGYKNPPKFNVSYIELPVTSSVLLFDSIRTSHSTYTGENNRMLVGKIVDPTFGTITSAAYTQFFTNTNVKIDTGATYMFATLTLKFDLYTYAPDDAPSTQGITIYELDEEMLQIKDVRLTPKTSGDYFRNSNVALKPTSIGTHTFTVNPGEFKTYVDDPQKKDTVITLTIPLADEFGQRILESAARYRDVKGTKDTTFVTYPDFIKQFKGLAIVPTGSEDNKIYGLSQDAYSRISVYYKTDEEDSIYFNLTFTGTTGFNKISADRSVSDLTEVTQKFQDYTPATEKRYIQSATGIYTKLDFSSYLAFADTIPNMIINSAELSIGGVEIGGKLTPPRNLGLRILKNNNRLYEFVPEVDQTVYDNAYYNGSIVPETVSSPFGIAVDRDSAFSVVNDSRSSFFSLVYDEDDQTYTGYMTMFLQQLFYKRENKSRFKNFVLVPQSPVYNKSVNRAVFPANNIKLKIYYTRPIKDNL